jgi:hypothetical protein
MSQWQLRRHAAPRRGELLCLTPSLCFRRAILVSLPRSVFEKPIFQTFGMFVGMCFGLVMHFVVMMCKIPFPGYDYYAEPSKVESVAVRSGDGSTSYGAISETDPLVKDGDGSAPAQKAQKIPVWMYFFLAIPAVFDLAATALCMMGLQYIDVSIYQLLRGSGKKFWLRWTRNLGYAYGNLNPSSFYRTISHLRSLLSRDYFRGVDEAVCAR